MGEQVAAKFNGGVAQLGEHLPCKQGVKSSNLSISIDCLNSQSSTIIELSSTTIELSSTIVIRRILRILAHERAGAL